MFLHHQNKIKKNKNRLSNYINHEKDVNYTGIKFSVTINQISKIEKLNKIKLNIFTLNKNTVLPLYISDKDYNKTCEMLLL